MVCLPVGPHCGECQLNNGLCPSAKRGASSQKKRKIFLERSPGPNINIAIEIEHTLTAEEDIGRATIQQQNALVPKPEEPVSHLLFLDDEAKVMNVIKYRIHRVLEHPGIGERYRSRV